MNFEWDRKKALVNLGKHGVDFADATEVFYDERALTISHTYPREERFVTMGMDSKGRILAVAFTWRGDRIRIISARKATRKEQQQ